MRLRRQGKRALIAACAVVLAALVTSACTGPAHELVPGPTQANGSLPSGVEKQLKTAVTDAMKLADASGAIAGVWAPWSGSWTAAEGTTARKGGKPMTTQMRFRIGQNTRSMTCTVLLALVDAGTVKLDDPVTKYLPDMSDVDDITLEQLCRNTAGIGDYTTALAAQFVNNPTRSWPQMELLTDGLAEARPGRPGEKFSSSDAGYFLLGLALQRASGTSWTELYQKYIFDRLGMTASSFPESNPFSFAGTHPQGYATALEASGSPRCGTVLTETNLSASMAWTAGGVISSLADMRVYAQALAAGALVSSKSAKEQWTTVAIGGDAPTWEDYGLGVETFGPLRGHSGQIPGFITATLSEPKSGLTVVVMLNNSSPGAEFAQTLARQLASIASKAPATKGSAPVIALPWSSEQAAADLTGLAVCQQPATSTPAP